MSKEKALEKYDDAVAGGNTAVMAEEKEEEKDMITLQVGNLLSGQEAVIHLQFLNILKVEAGAYCLRVPLSFFPNTDEANDYGYSFEVQIESSGQISITYVSCPNEAEVIRENGDKQLVIKKKGESAAGIEKDLLVYYRTSDMEQPLALA